MSAAPGWYHDGQGSLRYWDGQAWTTHTRPVEAAEPSAAPASSRLHGPSTRTVWIVGAGLAVLVLAGLALAASLALPSLRGDDAAATSSASPTSAGPDASPASPSAVPADAAALEDLVERFVLAWAAGDCTTEWSLSTRAWTFADSAEEYCAEQAGGLGSAEFVAVRIAGSTIDREAGTVTTVETYDWHGDGRLTEETWEYSAVLTAQGWKVAQTRFLD